MAMKKRIRKFRLNLDFPTRASLMEWFTAAKRRGLLPDDAELHGVCSPVEERAEFTFQGRPPARPARA